jgi:hypothetical protein
MTDTAAKREYVPLHPEIFTYDAEFVKRFVHPTLHDLSSVEKVKAAVNEVAEQLYLFRLYNEEYCQFLIEECEHAKEVVAAKYHFHFLSGSPTWSTPKSLIPTLKEPLICVSLTPLWSWKTLTLVWSRCTAKLSKTTYNPWLRVCGVPTNSKR